MVYGFARQSGGAARFTTAVDGGTVVRLYLPRAISGTAVEQPATAQPLRRGAGETILVVEDNASVALVTAEMLTSLGYRPITAPDGHSALAELARTKDVALVLTDVLLPRGMSGFALASAVQQFRPGLPIVFVSGFVNPAPVPDIGLKGAALLSKPVRSSRLADAIADALQQNASAITLDSTSSPLKPQAGEPTQPDLVV
jgi:CheY-like chemotaxis protein